jgi:hypothetical protein
MAKLHAQLAAASQGNDNDAGFERILLENTRLEEKVRQLLTQEEKEARRPPPHARVPSIEHARVPSAKHAPSKPTSPVFLLRSNSTVYLLPAAGNSRGFGKEERFPQEVDTSFPDGDEPT